MSVKNTGDNKEFLGTIIMTWGKSFVSTEQSLGSSSKHKEGDGLHGKIPTGQKSTLQCSGQAHTCLCPWTAQQWLCFVDFCLARGVDCRMSQRAVELGDSPELMPFDSLLSKYVITGIVLRVVATGSGLQWGHRTTLGGQWPRENKRVQVSKMCLGSINFHWNRAVSDNVIPPFMVFVVNVCFYFNLESSRQVLDSKNHIHLFIAVKIRSQLVISIILWIYQSEIKTSI